MGITERKKREKRKMRSLILNTAHKLFIKQGYANTSIRNIAKSIEYSPATLYLYFSDKDDILHQLKERYFEEFDKKLKKFHFIKDHFSRLKNISTSYLEYAISNPEHYELMFFRNINYNSENGNENSGEKKVYSILHETVNACLNQNLLKRMPTEEATMLVWSFLHGLASLILKDKFSEIQVNTEKDHIQEVLHSQ